MNETVPYHKTSAVFGPVLSRRLGRSLGVDLLPFKTCSLDCIYCECGATTRLTTERAEYYPTASVLREIDAVFQRGETIDYLTFSGVGEPTLHAGIGHVIEHVRTHYPETRVCLLTNGVHLGDPVLQRELSGLTLICPSLDASDEREFEEINRPAPGVTLSLIQESIESFRHVFPEIRMALELFLVPGINMFEDSVTRFRRRIGRIAPDCVQLNSLDRPGVLPGIPVPPPEQLKLFSEKLGGIVPVEIIARAARTADASSPRALEGEALREMILRVLRSRPCTAEDFALTLHVERNVVSRLLESMEHTGEIASRRESRGVFYVFP